ncbi:3-oxoacyl-[acyl-carrier-protein] synthase II, chloroplastic-like isoform X2 [Impatiens glandulifera]|uniref:3-oxoacyl-[acyl-carrier-protein] synthase II, chloroplastic-like isoform X2 n=1 Tax=Impatiens glandulifera TaxID=253017 RepID=UPI001FB11A8D|nr:3-oxoacyl-[acyl-carrier-protein] synthase II, chloroplastic-like isoform X2 [Impatiens glandulifera]
MATASSVMCTWFVAACMSISTENDYNAFSNHSTMLHFSPSKRFNRWARKRRALSNFCISGSEFPKGLISSLCRSNIRGLMTSCLPFEPCDQYNNSKGIWGDRGFVGWSLFGFCDPVSRRKRRMHRAARSVAVEPTMDSSNKKKQRRVVVTGMGVETPLGSDPDVFYSNLLEGVSGISEIESFDCSQFPTRIAGEIKSFSTEGWVAPKLSRRMDKFMLYILTAGKKALEDGLLTKDAMDQIDKTRCGVLIGSAMGGMKVFNDGVEALRVSYRKMNPFCVPFATTNMGSAMLAIDLGWMGPNYSISTACATSNFCIVNAANHIIKGEVDMMLCGGSDAAIIPIGLGGFLACRALSQRNNDPTKASRPWDTSRDGFVMGEGCGVLLLEELEHAKKRGAKIYAEFLGGSFTCDAHHVTEPHPEGTGVVSCIEKALAQSGVSREDVNYINAHATSTQAGDLKEYQALIRCFKHNPELKVNSTKSMIGHLLGAAGAVEAVAVVQAIRRGWVHPNVNLENPDECMDMNVLVGSKKEKLEIRVALSNSFGFGGQNSSILFAPYKH